MADPVLDIEDLQEGLLYKYTRIEDAPTDHRRVIRFAIQRFDIAVISELTKVSRNVIHRILAHPPNKKYLDMREFQVRAEQSIILDMMGESRMKCLELLHERLDEFGPTMKVNELIKIAELFLDRHPDGAVVKRSKSEITNNHHVVSGGKLDNLKRLAAQAGIEGAQKTIDVEAKEVSDDEAE